MAAFNDILATAKGPILGYCRTGNRSAALWALSKAPLLSADAICAATRAAGFDLTAMRPRFEAAFAGDADRAAVIRHDVVVVGGGAFSAQHGNVAANRARSMTTSRAGRWSAPACSRPPARGAS